MDVFGFQVGWLRAPWGPCTDVDEKVLCAMLTPITLRSTDNDSPLTGLAAFCGETRDKRKGSCGFSSDPFCAESLPPMFVTTRGGSATCTGGVCPTCPRGRFLCHFRHQQSPTPTAPVVEKFTAAPAVTYALPVPVFE